jgi:hypothetical protein
MAVQERWKAYLNPERVERANASKSGKKFTHAELLRIIDLRVRERKSMEDIGKEMGRTGGAIMRVWHLRCKHMVPPEVLQNLRPSNAWSSEDDDRLVALYNKGMKLRESVIQAHFPGKTLAGASLRLYTQRNRLVRRQTNAPPALMATLKRKLETYVDVRPARGDLLRIHESFPMFSISAIKATLRRMRTGRAAPQRLRFDEIQAEREIASRSSRRAA